MDTQIDIRITHSAFLKLRYFIEECPTEVSGFGKVRKLDADGNEYFEIYEIEILEQEVSGTHSTISDEVLAKFLFEKQQKGESVEDYKVWWHSHATMSAFFSGTDTGTIDGSTEFPYLISIVGNKAGDIETRFDLYDPIRLTFTDLEIKVGQVEDESIRKQCQDELKKKIKKPGLFKSLFSDRKEDDDRQHQGKWFPNNKNSDDMWQK